MKNFLDNIFSIFALICCVDLIYEGLNHNWFFDFENNYIFIALLFYQGLSFSKRKYANFKSYFTKLSLFEIIFLVYVLLFFIFELFLS